MGLDQGRDRILDPCDQLRDWHVGATQVERPDQRRAGLRAWWLEEGFDVLPPAVGKRAVLGERVELEGVEGVPGRHWPNARDKSKQAEPGELVLWVVRDAERADEV